MDVEREVGAMGTIGTEEGVGGGRIVVEVEVEVDEEVDVDVDVEVVTGRMVVVIVAGVDAGILVELDLVAVIVGYTTTTVVLTPTQP